MNDTRLKPWHSPVEKAVQAALSRDCPVDVDKLLDSAGLFSWAPHRAAAREYAEKLLDGGAL